MAAESSANADRRSFCDLASNNFDSASAVVRDADVQAGLQPALLQRLRLLHRHLARGDGLLGDFEQGLGAQRREVSAIDLEDDFRADRLGRLSTDLARELALLTKLSLRPKSNIS